MFMQIAIGAIGIGIVLMVGYLVIANVQTGIASGGIVTNTNPCFGLELNASGCANNSAPCYTTPTLNTTATVSCLPRAVNLSLASTQTTVFAGFGLLAVGIIVLAAFGLINVFN